MTNPVIVVGGTAIDMGTAASLRRLAVQRRVGMLNTFAAKGLFAWDDPAHLGTIGLQVGDLELAGLRDADVLLVGVPDHEIGRDWLRSVGARCHEVEAGDLPTLIEPNDGPTPRPELYGALAAVCGPMYADATLPMNPARAAADLAAWLPVGGVVQAARDAAGFWLGRTFPTRELGSVRFGPGIDARPVTVHVVSGGSNWTGVAERVDAGVAVVEVWSADGPAITPTERLERLAAGVARGRGAVFELGVDSAALDALIAVAGEPLWGAPIERPTL
ncbi:MAG TPA: hypothetical protein VES40_17095 [Ilumatobacteraceae bacterium]|nr:hypothetical protein [Ilumatobacteraceae bacterium]